MNLLYLYINLGAFLAPFLLSFDKKVAFYKSWKALFPAILITAVPFILWDMVFTADGVWGFNDAYLSGITIGNLPLEEVMFFFTIPYASVFIYACFVAYTKRIWFSDKQQRFISLCLVIFSLIIAIIFRAQIYTAITFFCLAIYTGMLILLKKNYLGTFYLAYLIIAIPFFIVNGILTGSWIPEEVVWYNDTAHLGIRLGTIPIVDFFYGMLLIMMNVSILEYLKKRWG